MCSILLFCWAYLRIICICIVKVPYKAQLYVIMYNLCYIKVINSDNVGIMLHNFARYSDKVYCAFGDFNHKLFVTNIY
jgi:hypothetical protein